MRPTTSATLLALVCAAACGTPSNGPGYARSAGSLAISADSQRLFIADQDNATLDVVDAASGRVIKNVAVGEGPVRALVGPDGRVYVANRFDRSVSVVDPTSLTEIERVHVGAEPVGLAFTLDGRTLLVVNHTSRTLTFVDVASLRPVKEIALTADPTGVTVTGDEAFVSYARSPTVSVVDVASRSLSSKSLSLALTKDETGGDSRVAGQAVTPVFDPGRGRMYVAHVQSKTDLIPTEVGTTDAYVGTTGTIPVVANALATVDVVQDKVLPGPALQSELDGCGDCMEPAPPPTSPDGAPMMPAAPVADVPSVLRFASGPLAGPSAAVLDPSGNWLYETNIASSNVSVLAVGPGESDLPPVKVGRGPNGIALDGSGKTAFVYNSFDHTLSVLAGENGAVVVTNTFAIGESSLTPEQQLGRQLFYAADDDRMTNPQSGGIACASCHPGGREDGRTWQFSEGPRNTPTLAGRDLMHISPYHWDGSIKDFPGFAVVVEQRMGGTGLMGEQDPLADSDFDAIFAFLQSLPAPDNPNRTTTPSASALRGKALFEGQAGCIQCHSGPDHTDRLFHDVGTIGVAEDGQPELFPNGGVKTPTLNNLFNTAPYLHNGSMATLRDRLTHNDGDIHGVTSDLTSSQIDDLVAYLKTL